MLPQRLWARQRLVQPFADLCRHACRVRMRRRPAVMRRSRCIGSQIANSHRWTHMRGSTASGSAPALARKPPPRIVADFAPGCNPTGASAVVTADAPSCFEICERGPEMSTAASSPLRIRRRRSSCKSRSASVFISSAPAAVVVSSFPLSLRRGRLRKAFLAAPPPGCVIPCPLPLSMPVWAAMSSSNSMY